MIYPIPLHILVVLTALATSASAQAGDLNLVIRHTIHSLGADGVSRNSEFSERLYRRNDQVWIERIIPAAAEHDNDHAHAQQGVEHKHLDLAASARWIVRDAKGVLKVNLVNRHERTIVDIPQPEYANVGFDGDWGNAYHLISPRHMATMQPTGQAAPTGAKWFASRNQSGWVRVLWDEKQQYPRQVESGNAAGTQRRSMMASLTPAPVTLPWATLKTYQRKEYSDTLD
ncbi:MAG: hypothetical protein HY066_16850 [Betaproteobacteria bacterium]|nr:hypothetical protein [Betaproteobacteria bacterium]